jgi:hypothetical protein
VNLCGITITWLIKFESLKCLKRLGDMQKVNIQNVLVRERGAKSKKIKLSFAIIFVLFCVFLSSIFPFYQSSLIIFLFKPSKNFQEIISYAQFQLFIFHI